MDDGESRLLAIIEARTVSYRQPEMVVCFDLGSTWLCLGRDEELMSRQSQDFSGMMPPKLGTRGDNVVILAWTRCGRVLKGSFGLVAVTKASGPTSASV